MSNHMADPAMQGWQMAADIGNVLVAATAVYLLGQGLADRRKIRDKEEQMQASRVHLSVRDNMIAQGSHMKNRVSRTIRLRNDSDLPVALSGYVVFRRKQTWEAYLAAEMDGGVPSELKPIEFQDSLLRPGEELTEEDHQFGWDYAVVDFTDASGLRWKRISTGELIRESVQSPLRCRVFQFLAQLPILKWVLATLPNRYLAWRFKRKEAVPLSARVYRWLWGYMPIGEPEPWTMPQGAKSQDWPYEFMLSLGRYERRHGQRSGM